jgi:hypothetical protein
VQSSCRGSQASENQWLVTSGQLPVNRALGFVSGHHFSDAESHSSRCAFRRCVTLSAPKGARKQIPDGRLKACPDTIPPFL